MELGTELGLALGDIAGKGLTAGIWQAHLMALIQRSARTHSDPADVVAEVNRELCHDEGAPPLTALFFARIDPVRSELVYCNAGLPAPLLLRDNKRMEHLEGRRTDPRRFEERAVLHRKSRSKRGGRAGCVLRRRDGVQKCTRRRI